MSDSSILEALVSRSQKAVQCCLQVYPLPRDVTSTHSAFRSMSLQALVCVVVRSGQKWSEIVRSGQKWSEVLHLNTRPICAVRLALDNERELTR